MILDTLLLVKLSGLLGTLCMMVFMAMFVLRKTSSSKSYINIMSLFPSLAVGFLFFAFYAFYAELSLNLN